MEETSRRKHEKDWFKERRCGRSMQVKRRCKKSCRSSGMHPATSSHWKLNRIKTELMMNVQLRTYRERDPLNKLSAYLLL